jgi:UDP-N-acetylmuramate dehydrogenase
MSSTRAAPECPIRENVPLKPFTTFKIGGPARYFVEVRSPEELSAAITFAKERGIRTFVLGGGSNILVSDRGFDGLVAHPANRGMKANKEENGSVQVRTEAAETWDDVVAYSVERGWWGIENLSHIPGQAGAALVQNIGAYGEQLSDVFESAAAADLASGQIQMLQPRDCRLGYRTSIFNTTGRGRHFIFSLTLRLSERRRTRLEYKDLAAWFDERGVRRPSQKEIREAVIEIRDRKFPFPREERGGNAGSFFKNLVLTESEYSELERRFELAFSSGQRSRLRDLRNRAGESSGIKIPTAFLIEVCELKRRRVGGAEVNERQPLVLLNQGGATADDVMSLAREVRRALYARLGVVVSLEPEPVGFSDAELRDYLSLE